MLKLVTRFAACFAALFIASPVAAASTVSLSFFPIEDAGDPLGSLGRFVLTGEISDGVTATLQQAAEGEAPGFLLENLRLDVLDVAPDSEIG